MTDQMSANPELARRLLRCRHFRWMPGMLLRPNGCASKAADRVAGVNETHIQTWAESWPADGPRGMWVRYSRDRMAAHVPDLTDHATLGCLLAMVAKAHSYSIDDVHVVRTTGGWSVWLFRADGSSARVVTREPGRVEALVAALEAAL